MPYTDGYIFEDILNFLTNVTTGTILMRHAALDECGYFDETLLRQQDIQLFACFSYRYKIKLLREYLLNIDISDGQNRPNINTLWVVKKAYINSVDSILRQLPQKQQKQLQFHIKTEVGIQMLRRGRPWDGIKAVTSCLKSPRVFFLEVRKNVMLLAEILLKNCNYKKYSG
ncbi:hypothetical protein SDC9_108498 [bioreactor metagenome]|uniref:Uncharacterized protein n=1 Tax=bioreactor metagenome TaxID=1076179 RepID=A0A645B9B4_9ZZZZ